MLHLPPSDFLLLHLVHSCWKIDVHKTRTYGYFLVSALHGLNVSSYLLLTDAPNIESTFNGRAFNIYRWNGNLKDEIELNAEFEIDICKLLKTKNVVFLKWELVLSFTCRSGDNSRRWASIHRFNCQVSIYLQLQDTTIEQHIE